jgi:hypothetical protein
MSTFILVKYKFGYFKPVDQHIFSLVLVYSCTIKIIPLSIPFSGTLDRTTKATA